MHVCSSPFPEHKAGEDITRDVKPAGYIYDIDGAKVDGFTYLRFARKLNTGRYLWDAFV